MVKSLSLVLVLLASVGMTGCGLIEEQDGLTPDDFNRKTTPAPAGNSGDTSSSNDAHTVGGDVDPAPASNARDLDLPGSDRRDLESLDLAADVAGLAREVALQAPYGSFER